MSYAEIRQNILKTLGYFWTRIFQNADYIDGLSKALAIHLTDLEAAAEELPEHMSRLEIPSFGSRQLYLFRFSEADLEYTANHYGDGLAYGTDALYGQSLRTLEQWKYPCDATLAPMYLTAGFTSTTVWQKDIDYTLEDGYIVFRQDPLQLTDVVKLAQQQDSGEVLFDFFLWGFSVSEDYRAVKDFYGVLAGITGDSSEVYRQAVNIAWNLRTQGATTENIERLLALATGVDYVEQAGTVQDIFAEADRICVETENAVYTAPLETQVLTAVGRAVAVGELIFNSFTIRHSHEDVDFVDFEALLLNSGFLGCNYGSSLLIPNAEVNVLKRHRPGWSYVTAE